MDDHLAGGYHIFYSASSDGGLTWSMPEKVDTRMTGSYSKFVDLDFTPTGIPVVVWEDNRFGDSAYKVFLSKRDPSAGGTPWTANVQVNTIGSPPDGSYFMNPSLAVLDDRRLAVAWTDWRQGALHQVYSRRTSDGGISWGPEVRVSDGLGFQPVAGDPCLVVDPSDSGPNPGQEELLCVTNDWRGNKPGGRYPNVYFYRSTDGGATWSIGVQVNDIVPLYQQTSSHALAQLTDGRITAGWLNSTGGFSEFRTCVSSDEGATWTPSAAANPAGSDAATYSSIIALGNTAFAGFNLYETNWNAYFNASTDGGLTWPASACRMDDDVTAGASMNSVIAAASASRIYGAWSDSRPPDAGPWKIYATTGDLATTALGPEGVPPASGILIAPNPSPLGSPVRIAVGPGGWESAPASRILIVDAAGRVQRALSLPAQANEVVWDGADRAGRMLAPGVYWLCLEPAERVHGSVPAGDARRLVRIR
jgi:hypothetical protein